MPSSKQHAATVEPPPDQGILPTLLGYRLRLAQLAVFRDFERSVAEFSPGRVGVLILIEANPGITQTRLARAVGLERSTLVGVLHDLEARGVVARRRGIDRRTKGLWLTARGAVRLERVKRRIARHERRIAARLSAAQRARLLSLLGRLLP